MVKHKQPACRSSKPTKVPRKAKPHPLDASCFVDARASELFHSTFHNRKVFVEHEDLTHLVPPELLFGNIIRNFFDVDEASLSFSVFIRGANPVYPYLESCHEPPSLEAMSLLLFGRRYPYEGGTLYTSDFSVENHVLLSCAHSIAFPPDNPFPETHSGATTLSLSCAHLKRRQATTSASVAPSFVPLVAPSPSVLFSRSF
ncbi:hypothetical protein CJ030_MR6G006208 [Morella rubra]|uniref:Uncharacterized protein n=1 Tax=Morella rubra TaxID=262757 RepID=A0A6A1VB61_9ROSI|nr:hypothetical protein CJ030_MR6G006208 [Morella rubra]